VRQKNGPRGIADFLVILGIALAAFVIPATTRSVKERQGTRKFAADRCGPGTPGGCGNPNACCYD
jgi:hypothetical protein